MDEIINTKKELLDFGFANKKEYSAKLGMPHKNKNIYSSEDEIINCLKTIYDPEIPVSIYDLGLIYDIKITKGGFVNILMSLTAPGCPVAGEMPGQVADKISQISSVGEVEVKLIWDPPWTKDKMTEDAKLALDIE